MKYCLGGIAALLLLSGCQNACEVPLGVDNGWVRDLVPGRYMTAAYGEFTNCSASDITITGIQSPLYGLVEVHESQLVDGVSRMREIGPLTIPAHGRVSLEPGGKHLMLMKAVDDAAGAQQVSFQFQLNDGSSVPFTLPVRR